MSNHIKEQILILYRLCSKLNLYVQLGDAKKERVLKELAEIEKIVKDIMK